MKRYRDRQIHVNAQGVKTWSGGNRPAIAVKTLNDAEIKVAQNLEAEGYRVLKRGWPDFLAVKNGKVRFIEVKKQGQRLKKQQEEVKAILKLLGIEVEVIYGDEP